MSAKSGQLVTLATVLDRDGWTRTAVERFLGEPDDTARNPKYRSAAPMKLYSLARVKRAEQTKRFAAWKAQHAKRSDAAISGVITKEISLTAQIDEWQIEMPKEPLADVRRKAEDHHDARRRTRDDNYGYESANYYGADPNFSDRITVNYLRHRVTQYDAKLNALYGRVGKSRATSLVRAKVYAAIAAAYPELAEECERQRWAREERDAFEDRCG